MWLPFLPTDRLRRRSGGPPAERGAATPQAPLLVAERRHGALVVVAADRAALALGLRPGLALADARARVPHAEVEEADPAADAAWLEAIADGCDRFTPLVALDAPDGLLLDIAGCAHLFGGEAALGRAVLTGLARRGLAARGAIAGTPDAARALARFQAGDRDLLVVPSGLEAAHARPLPLAALGLDAARRLALGRAGLMTLADLADRPRAPLAARFGADLIRRLERTLGEAGAPISPRRPPPVFMVEQNFAEPIARIADALATLRALAGELMPRMERRGEGGRRFEASFFRSDGAVRRVDLATSLPCRDAPALARLFAERLEALADPLDPGFGFDLIRLAALVTEPLAPRQGRLDQAGPAGEAEPAEAVAALVDRLAARYGPARTVRLAPHDSHVPERATRRLPAALARPDDSFGAAPWPDAPAPGRPPHRPLSLFDPPQPVEALAEVPDGPPLRFRWRRVLHEIARAEGPERIAAEWWQEASDAPTRDYYQVEDAEGRRFWLFREGLYEREAARPRWFLHGLFA